MIKDDKKRHIIVTGNGNGGGSGTQVQSDWAQTDDTQPDYIKNKPTVPSGQVQSDWDQTNSSEVDYIKNKPTIPAAQVNSDWNATSGVAEILNKPTLATVATSGSYNDLSGKPTIPTYTSDLTNDSGFITSSDIPAQVQSNWNEADTTSAAYIQNKPTLATVATSGSYNDLSGKPTIPANTSDLTNDSGFITSSDIPAQVQSNWNESDNTSAAYIQNKPSIPAAQVNSDWNANSGVAQILNKPTIYTEWFGTQAQYDLIDPKDPDTIYHIEGGQPVQSNWNESDNTSLAYIQNKPTITQPVQSDWNEADSTSLAYIKNKPSVPSGQIQSDWNQTNSNEVDFIKNKPSLATVATSGSYNDLSGKPTIPTNTSDLTNDSGFITSSDIPAQVQSNWNESDNTSAAYIQNKPSIPAAQVNSDWSANSGVAQILNKPTLATVATSGSYNDLSGKPTIPANTSDLNNDSGFITSSDIPAQVQSNWNESDNTSAAYIQNKPTIPAAQVNSDWNANSGVAQILNKPTLATVATSGSYNDLSGKPTIPAAQVNSDWNSNSGISQILNKPAMATETLTFTLQGGTTQTIIVYTQPTV